VEKLQSYDALVRIVKYKIDIKKYEQGLAKTKGRTGGRVYTKMLILYNEDLVNLIEILKENISKFKIYLEE